MQRPQYVALLAALVLFLGLYLGFSTKPDKQKVVEQSRSLRGSSTSLDNLIADAREHLSDSQAATLAQLEAAVAAAPVDSARAEPLKRLSAWWYEAGQLPIAGGVAVQVAEIEQTDDAWSVAGATFYTALTEATAPIIRSFCADNAVSAFESAASLRPEQVEHRVNLALVYAENPKPDDPMRAVTLLRELESQHPDNPAVYNALGRLAIKTGQWERAIQRLEKAYSLDPKNPNTPCLLSKAYEGIGQEEQATKFAKICKAL
jgi:predicted Zn-dependent protease